MHKIFKITMSIFTFLVLAGCIYTHSDFVPATPSPTISSASPQAKIRKDILIRETDIISRPYRTVGMVHAEAHNALPFVSAFNPTHADINEELRGRGANIGADAIILVKYHNAPAGPGIISSQSTLIADGQAIIFEGQ